ncbi:MAG: hypothetical protein KatS3mg053_2790 [Candidatus Roseilinea sp.]|nr:MAG: hypothetical protein KatS3mg053_2790 [Candidatus Roseilinea sp.]
MIAIVFVAAAVALIVSSIITLWQLSTTTSDSHAMVARIAGMAPLLLSVSALIYASLFRLPMARPVEASGGWVFVFVLMLVAPASAAAGLFFGCAGLGLCNSPYRRFHLISAIL